MSSCTTSVSIIGWVPNLKSIFYFFYKINVGLRQHGSNSPMLFINRYKGGCVREN